MDDDVDRFVISEDEDEHVDESELSSSWDTYGDENEEIQVGSVPEPNAGEVSHAVQLIDEADPFATDENPTPFWEIPASKKKIVIVYHSLFGNLAAMAEELKRGVDAQFGCKAFIYRAPEVYSPKFLESMHATNPYAGSHPELTRTDIKHFSEADGFLFGLSARFGSMSAPMKAFFDSTGALWLKGSLIGRPAGIFTSTPAQGGGCETLALAAVAVLAHHGMLFVPRGMPGNVPEDEEGIASMSPFGANCMTALDGIRTPSLSERRAAVQQGADFARAVNRMFPLKS